MMEEMLTYMEPLQKEHQEEQEEEVQQVTAAGEGSASPDTTLAMHQPRETQGPEAPPTDAMEEQYVNLLDSGGEEEGEEQDFTEDEDEDDDDDSSETLVPVPPTQQACTSPNCSSSVHKQASIQQASQGQQEATPQQEPQQEPSSSEKACKQDNTT